MGFQFLTNWGVLGFRGAFLMGREWVAGLTLLPLVVKVNPNFNVVATACLTVFIGCHRSVKPAPPSVRFHRYSGSCLSLV